MNLKNFYVGADKALYFLDETSSTEVKLLRSELGELSIPSMMVGISDPAFIGLEALVAVTPKNRARVVVTEADVSDEQDGSHYRVAYLSLLFSDEAPASISFAEARDPESGDLFNEPGIAVDAGLGSFYDITVANTESEDTEERFESWCEAVEEGVNNNSALIYSPDTGENKLVITSSGWGDGVYPVLQTLGLNGELIGLHIDYFVVGELEDEE